MTTIPWRSKMGATLAFTAYSPSSSWNAVGGIYLFARVTNGMWVPSYIGQTHSFAERLTRHEQWSAAAQRGCTHVLAAAVGDEDVRCRLEEELIRQFLPVLNTHYAGLGGIINPAMRAYGGRKP